MAGKNGNNGNGHHSLVVCMGTGCVSSKSDVIYETLNREIEQLNLKNVSVDFTGCHGLCQRGPIVVVEPEGYFYAEVKPDDCPDIVMSLMDGLYLERLTYHDPETNQAIPYYKDIPFYSKQQRLVLGNCGHINPERIADYIHVGGYQALRQVLSGMTPEEIIAEVKKAGLRGRGGAGFPAAIKWESTRGSPGEPKYVVCNGDEGDPGAYMDRSVLEADPHSVIEGMVIGAYAIGASAGFIYVRAEYPLAVHRFQVALDQAREHGFLGANILNSGFDFDISIEKGSGAFVAGEATALIASIEGRTGEPRPRPPRTAQSGLWGKPTNINNVKTWSMVPLIIRNGADWFTSIGTEKSKGTAVFSLVGNVENQGLVEVPMGTTLNELVMDIGGGIPDGKEFKAVQTGGPSGGCIPAQFAHLPVDFESLTQAGSIMGSGGMVVMDSDTCMVYMAKYFIDFTMDESCGKCTPCREGTRRMLEILTDITEGRGKEGDIQLLEEMGLTIIESSLCGLGGTAPNPVLTTIRYFLDEYEAHINEKRCPALVCKELITYYILPDKCQGCMICARSCPVDAIKGGKRMVHVVEQDKCIKCGSCIEVCPVKFNAVVKVSGETIDVPSEPIPVGGKSNGNS